MWFYQAHGEGFWGDVKSTADEAFRDLEDRGFDITGLSTDAIKFPLFDPELNIGIAVIHV